LAGWAVRRGLRVREKKIKSFLLYARVSLKKKRKDKRLGEGGGDGGYSSWVLFL
jgi:hypothetical protein